MLRGILYRGVEVRQVKMQIIDNYTNINLFLDHRQNSPGLKGRF